MHSYIIRNAVFASALALGLGGSGIALAQSATGTPGSSAPDLAKQQNANRQNAPTVEKLKQELQNAGFTDVQVLEDAFLVQAKTKEGNPILMTIGSNGMNALEMSRSGGANDTGTTGQAPPKQKGPSGSASTVQQ